jgi:hypothetical protein
MAKAENKSIGRRRDDRSRRLDIASINWIIIAANSVFFHGLANLVAKAMPSEKSP